MYIATKCPKHTINIQLRIDCIRIGLIKVYMFHHPLLMMVRYIMYYLLWIHSCVQKLSMYNNIMCHHGLNTWHWH